MTIFFEKKVFGIRSGNYINKRYKTNSELIFPSLNNYHLDFFLNKISNVDKIDIYIRYSYSPDFIDDKYKYIWIRVDKNYLIYLKYNLSYYN